MDSKSSISNDVPVRFRPEPPSTHFFLIKAPFMLTIMLPKKQLIEFLTKTIAAELAAITAAAINTYADATHADSKPENK